MESYRSFIIRSFYLFSIILFNAQNLLALDPIKPVILPGTTVIPLPLNPVPRITTPLPTKITPKGGAIGIGIAIGTIIGSANPGETSSPGLGPVPHGPGVVLSPLPTIGQIAKKPNGAPCINNGDCESEACLLGKCQACDGKAYVEKRAADNVNSCGQTEIFCSSRCHFPCNGSHINYDKWEICEIEQSGKKKIRKERDVVKCLGFRKHYIRCTGTTNFSQECGNCGNETEGCWKGMQKMECPK